MSTANETRPDEVKPGDSGRRLYRSNSDKVLGGVSAGLGDYFGIDPVWIRIAFVLLTVGGGSGIVIYLIMWILIPAAPEGYVPQPGKVGGLPGTVIIGLVFIVMGSIALVNTIAPWLGQYFWPLAFVGGGLALVFGGMIRDRYER
jgi:phage shock protein PspC (stress-responsive transcriptional regulator)